MFALRDVKVAGGSPLLQAQVQEALAPELGRSLVALSAADVERRLAAVPGVLAVRYDRDFPHTLARRHARAGRPRCCARARPAGSSPPAAACCARSRTRTSARCPASGSAKDAAVRSGERARAPRADASRRSALAPLAGARFPARVADRAGDRQELTLVLRSGLELRLGDAGDLRLKLAVARRILLLPGAATAAAYIDVSVPERPVSAVEPSSRR